MGGKRTLDVTPGPTLKPTKFGLLTLNQRCRANGKNIVPDRASFTVGRQRGSHWQVSCSVLACPIGEKPEYWWSSCRLIADFSANEVPHAPHIAQFHAAGR